MASVRHILHVGIDAIERLRAKLIGPGLLIGGEHQAVNLLQGLTLDDQCRNWLQFLE